MLGLAGYLWDDKIGACIRTWEIQGEDQIKAAHIAAKYCDNVNEITILDVKYNNCIGCFTVNLSLNN
ncbi:MAG: hypothetical protein AB8U25_03770 [Rickettsiales endosymbiont of Dermacentor nuttalli]